MSVSLPCRDLADVNLADKDTKSISTAEVNWAIKGSVTMQVAKAVTNGSGSGATWWPDLQPMHVTMCYLLVAKFGIN